MQKAYIAIIEKAAEGYGVFFPDLPGLASFGETIGEAASNAAVAAQGHAAVSAEHGEQLPEPSAWEDIAIDQDIEEAARLIVLVETADEKQRVNITLPKSVLAALDATAQSQGQDRSALIAQLVRRTSAAVAAAARVESASVHHLALYDAWGPLHMRLLSVDDAPVPATEGGDPWRALHFHLTQAAVRLQQMETSSARPEVRELVKR